MNAFRKAYKEYQSMERWQKNFITLLYGWLLLMLALVIGVSFEAMFSQGRMIDQYGTMLFLCYTVVFFIYSLYIAIAKLKMFG